MKVLYIVTAYDRHPGDGITPWLVETIRRLGRRGVEVEVLAPSYRGLESRRIDGVMVHRFRYAPAPLERLTHDQTAPDRVREHPLSLGLVPGYLASASLAAARLARSRRFQVVHVHWPLPHVVPGWAARAAGDVPLVITFHGVELTFARNARVPLLVPLLRRAIRSADAVTANSSYTAGMVRRLHDRPVEILPFGTTVPERTAPDRSGGGSPSDPEGESASGGPAGPPDLLFVGRLVERKGVCYLLHAMQRLVPDHGARLTVVGEGPLRESLEREAVELGVAEHVTFAGFVSTDELARRLSRCDVFVLPAVRDAKGDEEGLGVVLVEALSFSRPVVASRSGGIVDVIRHEETGLLVPPADPEALARSIGRLLDDPALARRLGEAGRRHVDKSFSWDPIVDRLISLYQRLVA